jgi:hypothetical protein
MKSSFTDEATFNDSATNRRNSHVWSLGDLHTSTATQFENRFSVNIWCSGIGSKIMRPFVLEKLLTFESYFRFLEEELPVFLEMWLQQDEAPPSFW